MSNKYLIYCSVAFPYGFYRQWNSKMPDFLDLYGHRFIFSSFNGFIYLSPIGIYRIFNLINRIDIKYNKRDKLKYSYVYEESFGINYDTV